MPACFTPETFRFLRGLAKNNDRGWFEERRPTYERAVKTPLLALTEEISTAMDAFAPEHIRPAHKVAMRIFRDTRFSPDKRPYKTHLSAWWSRRGLEKASGAGFYLHIAPEGGYAAAGLYAPDKEGLLAFRRWLSDHHEHFRATTGALLSAANPEAPMQSIEPDALTRNPKGFATDHPASDLLRSRNWGVSAALAPALLLSDTLAMEVATRFRHMAALVHLMNEPLLDAVAGRSGQRMF